MDALRRDNFLPYRGGHRPLFTLTLWETGKRDHLGKDVLRYRLEQDGAALFEGEDFACSLLHAIDSDETVRSLMGFLTCRPGDVETEYFKDYTARQMAFVEAHAEALALCVEDRFGEEHGD